MFPRTGWYLPRDPNNIGRTAVRHHRRIGDFTAVFPFPFRTPTQCAVLVRDLRCDVEALLSPKVGVGSGQFGHTGSWKSASKVNHNVS